MPNNEGRIENDSQNVMTHKEQYLASVKAKREIGLTDVKFFSGNSFDKAEDQVYAELNRLASATDLPDREVLGNRSPR